MVELQVGRYYVEKTNPTGHLQNNTKANISPSLAVRMSRLKWAHRWHQPSCSWRLKWEGSLREAPLWGWMSQEGVRVDYLCIWLCLWAWIFHGRATGMSHPSIANQLTQNTIAWKEHMHRAGNNKLNLRVMAGQKFTGLIKVDMGTWWHYRLVWDGGWRVWWWRMTVRGWGPWWVFINHPMRITWIRPKPKVLSEPVKI